MITKGAIMSTKYAIRLAKNFHLSKYLVGLIVVSVISILPETLISINSSIEGIPEFGLGTLFGSNIADLTLVFAIIIAISHKGIRIDKKILKNNSIYPLIFFIPILMGLNGSYSRTEGFILIISGIIFYYFELKNGFSNSPKTKKRNGKRIKNIFLLIFSMIILLIGSHFTVISAMELAHFMKISPVLIGMLIVGIGTTIPELIFSLHAIKQRNNSLAVGDILGTVLADATIVIGILVVINPFSFEKNILYVSGFFMLLSAFTISQFLRTGKILTKKEGWYLLIFWIIFALTEYLFNK